MSDTLLHDNEPGHDREHRHIHGLSPDTSGATGIKLLLSILIIGLALVAEIVGGILKGSLAHLSDAVHVFLHILALALSYGAVRLAVLKEHDHENLN